MKEESDLVKARIAFITDIEKLGNTYQEVAGSAAMSMVRKPQDKDAVAYAHECVTRHDERNWMADEMIKLVWKHWPRDPE